MLHNDFFHHETPFGFGTAPTDFSSPDVGIQPSVYSKFPPFPSTDSDSDSDSYLSSNSQSPAPLISSPESLNSSPQPNNISFTAGSNPQPAAFPLFLPQTAHDQKQVTLPGFPITFTEPPSKKQRCASQSVPVWTSDNEDDIELEVGFKFLSEAEQKRRRLARKAELARMSRKRKKTKMGDLEAEVLRLQSELDELRRERSKPEVFDQSSSKPSNELDLMDISMKNMIQASKSASLSASISSQNIPTSKKNSSEQSSPIVQRHMDEYIHAFHRHQAATTKQLDSIGVAIDPSTMLPLTFLNWLCSQSDKVIQDPAGLWSNLFASEIGVSPDQMKDLLGLRLTIKKQRKVSSDVERAYKKLNTNLRRQMQQQGENMTRLRSILSSVQMAKLFEWVQHHGNLCMNPTTTSPLPVVVGGSVVGSSAAAPVSAGSLALALQIIQAAQQQQQQLVPPPPMSSTVTLSLAAPPSCAPLLHPHSVSVPSQNEVLYNNTAPVFPPQQQPPSALALALQRIAQQQRQSQQ